MNDSRLLKIVFNWDVDLGFINSWSKDIEDLFTNLDFYENFINWQPVSINSVWVLLHEDVCKNWEDNIKMRPVLNLRKFSFMSRQCRSYLPQLRNHILALQLEVGRWTNEAAEEWL